MKNIAIKNIIMTVFIFLGVISLISKYGNYREIKNNGKILVENRNELNKKILEMEEEKKKQKAKIQDDYVQITVLSEKIASLSIKNESEFKKMIYVFARESDLKLKEVSKSENLWERNGYRLKYIHFNLYGSLNDFGKFLFFINKSKKYIDTSRTYIKLSNEGFRISLGFIEKASIGIE